MKKLLLIIFFLPFAAIAQHLELGAMLGASNYYGDLAPDPYLNETNFAYGVYARLNLSSSFALTGSITSATISGNDNNRTYTKTRNLNFKTPLTEYAMVVEFNFLKYGVDVLDKKFSPYVFVGIALTQFDPQATYPGIGTFALRNYRTENVQYGSYATCLPFGMGVKWQFHRHFGLQANIGFRKAYTDYLDDVSTVYPDPVSNSFDKGSLAAILSDPSVLINNGVPAFPGGYTRGNADNSDWYMIGGISLSYRFYKRSKCRRFY